MNISAIDILILITIFQLLVFSILIFCLKNGKRINNLFLGSFFLALSINIFNSFVYREFDYFLNHCIHIFYLGSSFALLYSPLFYLFILTYNNIKKIKLASILLHFIPFIFLTVYIVYSFSLLPVAEKKQILLSGGLFRPVEYKILVTLVHVQVFVYLLFIIRKIKFFRKSSIGNDR